MTVTHATCRMGTKCVCATATGGPAHLNEEPYTKLGLCARCYRKRYRVFPWAKDPRDEIGHPECLRNPREDRE